MAGTLRAPLSHYALALALALAALAGGAVHLPILLGTAALIIISAGLWMLDQGPHRGAQRIGSSAALGAGVCLGLAAICALQTLPLPVTWLAHLAPDNADIWSRALRPFQASPPDFACVSLAPQRTLVEALKFATYGLVFAISSLSSQRQANSGPRYLATAFGAALLVALVTAAHQLLGADALYGAYRPLDAYSIAPLLNANNRAGFLNLGFFCGLGLLFRAGQRPAAALLGLGLAFIAAEILLCESLGGSGSLAIGLLLVLLLPRFGRKPRPSEVSRRLQLGICVAIGVGASCLALAARRSALGLDDRSTEKLDLFLRTWKLALDHFWLGIGRGAFASVFSAYQGPGQPTYEHAENFPLQWAAEWGVPLTILAFAASGWALRSLLAKSTFRSSSRRCALVGCAMLLLQNLVDLGLEVPAVAAMLAHVLGGLVGSSRSPPTGPAPRHVLGVGSAIGVGCLVVTLIWGADSTAHTRHRLYAELTRTKIPSEGFWRDLQAAMRTYPAEPYFPVLGSSAALASGKNPLPWISRALERSPGSAEVHIQLARVLNARGATDQALGALRRAVELAPTQMFGVVQLGSSWGLSSTQLAVAAPAGPAGAPLLLTLAYRAEDDRLRLQLLEQALARDPSHTDAHHDLALTLLRDVQRKEKGVACAGQRDACLERAAREAQLGAQAQKARTGILQARLLAERGLGKEAEAQLVETCERFAGDRTCYEALTVQALANKSPRLDSVVKELVATACGHPERCGQAHLWLGHQFAGAGQWNVALTHYRHAADEAPSPESWRAVARAADELGQDPLATNARHRLALLEAAGNRGAAASGAAQELGSHPVPSFDDPAAPASRGESPAPTR